MASYSVVFIDTDGNNITDKYLSGEIPDNTSKLVIYNTGLEFQDNWNSLGSVYWDDIYQGTGVETVLYNGSSVSDGEEVNYSGGDIEITVCYEYTPSSGPGGNTGGNTGGTGSTGNTGGDYTPMVVTFNYYVDGKLVDDTTFKAIEMDMGRPIDEIWPRTLECYHIRFDKINPVEDSNPGTSSNTSYNSLEFTYIYEHKFDENELVNNWPYTGTLNNYKLIHAFSDTYFSGENCVTINGIGYNPGENFTEKLIFHSNNTKTLEVNLYYTAVEVSTLVQSYNVDSGKYLEPDLWGYVYTQLGTRIFNDSFITTVSEIKYPVPLTSGNAVYCKARAKAGFEFSKWVSTSSPISGIESISNYENLTEKERREAVLALPAVETLDGSLPNTEIKLNGYRSNKITAVFKGLKNEVKLYKGLDFNGGDTYYIWGGDNQWKNSVNSDVEITIPTRKGAKLLGWVEYKQDEGTGEHPYITRSQYQEVISLYKTQEEAFNVICLFNKKINKGVIRIDNPDDEKPKAVLLSGVDGYTDRYGNWLTGNKILYPLWIVEEYEIKYVSEGEDDLVVDETEIDKENGQRYVLKPEDYKLPLTYTICGDNKGKDIVFPALEKQPNIDEFPVYKSFDRWEPSEIKKFSKTGPQTITAYWVQDTFKITLEKNNNWPNQSIKIKAGKSTFVNDEEIHNPTTRTAYKSFEGWYTENDTNTTNGTGDLIIDVDGKLQPGVEGFTDSEGKWIKKENTTVYAKWTPEEYTITYIIDGEDEPITRKYTIEDTKPNWYNLLSDPFGSLTPEGHYLDGWYTNKNCSGSQVSVLENGTTGDKTFYGRYKQFEYNIEYYNIDDCTNIEDLPVKHTYGSETELKSPVFPLHDFKGWYTDENFENPITSIPSDYTISAGGTGFGTIKLYAKKAIKPIPIYYRDSKGNDLAETSFNYNPPVSYDYENGTQLVEAHKNWYTFDGWYDNIECDGNSFMSLGAKEYTGIIILYCKFIPIEKTIKYYVDGAEKTVDGNPSKYTVEDLNPYITLKNPQDKPGYNSIGWRKNSPSSTVVLNKIASVEDLNLYWVWEPNVVTITWDANGGTVSQTSSTYTYNGDPVQLPAPIREGYVFDGWYTSKSGGTKITDVGVTNKPTKNITYYAQWSKQSYTLTWNPNGGTIPSTPAYTSGNVEYGTSIIKPGNPTKNYYVFTNWKDQYGNTNVAATMPAKNLTYTAQYEGKTITIKWDPNCSELITLITTYKYGEAVEPTNLIRPGYIFVGWSTTKDGSNIQSTFGGTTVTSDSITYYAVWNSGTGIKYTVKHYKQTLSGFYNTNPSETEEHYGTTGNSVTPSVKNYTGFTSPTPKTVIIAADGSTVVEYYYTRNKYTISWDANGGEELTGDYTKGSVYFETPIVTPNNPIREGYTFTEWISSVTEISGVPEIMPASDITFTASYEYEILDITPIEVDFNLETVEANKIATNKWIHNVLGEPEKTSWENLSNIFKTDFGSNITDECVTVSDLGYFITTQSQYKCKKQNETAAIFSNITTSSSQKQNKYYELLKMNSKLGSIEFKVTPVASTANIPNYPGTDGFIMYFSVGSNPKIYKATIPVNRTCRLRLRAVHTNDVLAIHRIPCYYGNSTYKIIVPVIYMTNNSSNVHKLYSNTVLLQQAVNR